CCKLGRLLYLESRVNNRGGVGNGKSLRTWNQEPGGPNGLHMCGTSTYGGRLLGTPTCSNC
ncbi:hypothetical protein LINPERPRIM_LOCUS2129, partial [Linum perenne]